MVEDDTRPLMHSSQNIFCTLIQRNDYLFQIIPNFNTANITSFVWSSDIQTHLVLL